MHLLCTNHKFHPFRIKEEYSLNLTTTGAGTELKDLFGTSNTVFSASKNIGFINLLISLLDEKEFIILDFFSGFRVIIMTQANSQVNTRVLELLPKFKIKKMNCWCAV